MRAGAVAQGYSPLLFGFWDACSACANDSSRMFQRFLGMLEPFFSVGIVASFYCFFQMRNGFFLVRCLPWHA